MNQSETVSSTTKNVNQRERSKLERKQKILVAARRNFAQHGYDRTTLRQVASEAGITVSALFKHITDKRDLIRFLFNEDLAALTTRALAAPRLEDSFPEKIMRITEHHYRHFAKHPMLSRVLLSESLVESPGLHLVQNLKIRATLIQGFEKLVREAQSSGELLKVESAEVIALQIFFVHAASLRHWLASSPSPKWRAGHRDYGRFLRLQLRAICG